MRLIDRLAAKFGYVKQVTEQAPIVPQTLAAWGLTYVQPRRTYSQLVDAYKSWVYTCIDKIAKSVAMIPLTLYEEKADGKRERLSNHPFLDLIKKPNPIMTRFMLWYETMVRLELGGMCGWLIFNNRLGLPAEIWPLPLTKTAELLPKPRPTGEIAHYEYRDGDIRHIFKPEEIVLLKYPHPESPYHAMSPLMAQTYPYDLDLFLMQQQRAYYDNMAHPGLLFTTDQELTPAQVQQLRDLLKDQYTGAIKAGKSMILHGGMKAQMLSHSAREAMIDEVARFAREKLITAFDLSEGKLGLVRDVNRANMEALNETFINECLRPKCMLIEEAIEAFLLPRWAGNLTCDFELPDVGDRALKLQERRLNLEMLYTTINEERAKEGLPPVPWGDRPWVSFSLVQAGGAPAGGDVKIKAYSGGTGIDEEWKQFVRASEEHEQLVMSVMIQHFRLLSEEVVAAVVREGARKFNRDAEAKRLANQAMPVIRHIVEQSGKRRIARILQQKRLKQAFFFNVDDPAIVKWIGERMRRFSREVTGTTFDEIERIVREGFTAGQPLAVVADQLRETFASWEQYRAPLIARTETIAAMNTGDLEAVKQSGLEMRKCWLTAMDERVRETHADAGVRYAGGIPLNEEFVVGRDRMQAPGNGTDPGENINCRCTLYYISEGGGAEE